MCFICLTIDVMLQQRVHLQSHVVVDGKTRVGCGTVVYPFASLGGAPQDKKHDLDVAAAADEWTLTIGRNCVIRERVTVHGRTSYSPCPTTIGDDCWLLCGAHIAHDAQLKRRVVVSNDVCVAGHVAIGDGAVIGGQVGLKQHVTVGPLAMVGGQSAVDGDVLPYGLVMGNRAKLVGLNLVGLRRAGVLRSEIKLLLQAYRYIFGRGGVNTGFAPALECAIGLCLKRFADQCSLPLFRSLTVWRTGKRQSNALWRQNSFSIKKGWIVDVYPWFTRW